MKRKSIAIAAGVGILVGSSTVALNLANVNASVMKVIKLNMTEEQLDQQMGNSTIEPTKVEFKEYLNDFEQTASPQFEDGLEKKLAQRAFVELKQSKNKIDLKNLKKEVKEQAEFDKAWVKYAEDEYGIKVTPQEIDEWISNGPDKFPVDTQKAYAEALGMSLKELNHTYYRDQYEKWVMWEKLSPLVAEKYGIKEVDYENIEIQENTPADEMNFNNKVLSLYEKEVTSLMK
ncbi:hypothetical protein GJU40_19310 [Bacillus lacus]|uniref:Uncharacterized protein n=1 Tax=Metabacillus lacus TaxID=1983721 RepID=A0A7X2LZ51_9BACI|nr:hypothetical protein [Metabacillus lacus]MRX74270.1 hypothetical protein [Metabacillus lacus]